MSFIRPEMRQHIYRWREVLFAIALGLIGLWIYRTGGIVFHTIGGIIMLVAIGLGVIGWRRVRLNFGTGGLGVVEVDERQITYLLSYGGFTLSITDITAIEIHTNALGPLSPDLFWVFKSMGQHPQSIAGNAVGAEKIYDVLANFQGVYFDRAMAATKATDAQVFVIWKQKPRSLN